MTDDAGSGDDQSGATDGESPGPAGGRRRPDRTLRDLVPVPTGDHPSAPPGGPPGDADGRRCDYCRLPLVDTSIRAERDDVDYAFCSGACRDALVAEDRVFTEYHGHRRLTTGVSVLDDSLPQGLPRNSLVVLGELAGSRIEAVQAELAWRTLRRGEPVVFVTFLEPPVSVVQGFVDLDWNVLPALERGELRILDCFSYRVEDRDRMYERMNAWNRHLWDVAREATTTVRDPTDVSELQNRIDGVLEEAGMHDRGTVVLDSLTELGSLTQPVQAYNFLKDVRADVCKGRFVPIFAGATVGGDGDEFPLDLEYMVDGLVDLDLTGEVLPDALVKRLRVRKMNGVLAYPEWRAYEYAAGTGAVAYDPGGEPRATDSESDSDTGGG